MEKKRKARVFYNQFDDRFDIEIQHDDGTWGLSSGFECQHCLKEAEQLNAEANFISYEVLFKIRELIEIGYKVYLMGTWIKGDY